MRHRLLISARSLLLGWAALFVFIRLIQRPLFALAARLLGASWLSSLQVVTTCLGLAVIGWIVGHGNRFDPLIFAVSLCMRNFGFIDVPFLLRLTLDVFENLRYLESFFTSLAIHVFMFGSLFAGAQLNRARRPANLTIK